MFPHQVMSELRQPILTIYPANHQGGPGTAATEATDDYDTIRDEWRKRRTAVFRRIVGARGVMEEVRCIKITRKRAEPPRFRIRSRTPFRPVRVLVRVPARPVPPGHLSIIATASLQGLRVLASNPPSDSTLSPWLSIYRSALLSLLKLCDGQSRYDRCVILLSCVVMASAAPKSVVLGHSGSFHRLVHLMREQLQSEHPKVVCKALQSLASLFSRKDISTPFVKNLGEDVFNVMKPFVVGQTVNKMLTDVSDDQLLMLQEAEKVVVSLAHIANERKRPPIVSLLNQSLCRLLLPTAAEEWRQMSPASRWLHDFVIGRLNVVAPTWPAEFKSILAAHPELKKRLEGALVFQASRNALALQTARAKQAENKTANSQQQQPTIKLKMDFNAFQKA